MKNLYLTLLSFLLSFAAYAVLPPITGTLTVCYGNYTPLNNSMPGGTWTSSNVAVATVNSTGWVGSVSVGTATITYTVGVNSAYAVVTVNQSPAPVTGASIFSCGTTSFASSPVGGAWISSNPSIATINAMGIASAVSTSSGSTVISYVLPNGCYSTTTLHLEQPSIIIGPYTLCQDLGYSCMANISGGMWSSSDTSVVRTYTYTTSTDVWGTSAGTAVISYTMPAGCYATRTVSVHPAVAIAGSFVTCVGLTTSLTTGMSGGTWFSGDTTIAEIDSTTGAFTGIGYGQASINYIASTGCYKYVFVTVNDSPPTITGDSTLCVGTSISLVSSFLGSGSSWSSSATSIASVSDGGSPWWFANGVVTGLAVGTTTISVSSLCGISTKVVTVNSSCTGPPLTGTTMTSTSSVCSGMPLMLSLPAYTYTCGHVIQWQYSTDGTSWSDLPGANTAPYTYNPTNSYYYRCRVVCGTSTSYSSTVHVGVDISIGTYSVISAPDTSCVVSHFYVAACGVSPAFSVTTFFGDGTSTTTGLTSYPPSDAELFHTYTTPGTYTVKHVLYDGATAVDTVSFDYNYMHCRTLPIKFFKDNNGNCVKDAGDIENLIAVTTCVDSNGIPIDTIIATSGLYYKAYGPPGTIYAFHPLPAAGSMLFTCPSSGVIYDTISAYTNTYVAKSFGMSCGVASSFDLKVNATTQAGRHTNKLNITVRNQTCNAVSPVVTLSFNPKYGYYPGMYPCNMTSPTPTSVVGKTITWSLAPLDNNETKMITIYVERLGGPGMFLIPGDTVMNTISVSPTTGNADTTNNMIIVIDTVKSSYDPNDIAVLPEGNVLPCTLLSYKVRFENTGNDTAHNIYVLDTLAPGLDPSTLAIEDASAPMYISVVRQGGLNIAKFDFPNINLLDSSHYGLCDGVFFFNIKVRNGITDGIDIPNRVGIYFDDNPVVMTNTVTNITGIGQIKGPDNVCIGYPVTLSSNSAGGAWGTGTPSLASVSSGGVVSGVAAGIAAISYTATNSCTSRSVTHEVTVNPVVHPAINIAASTGDIACAGTSVTYSTTPTGGGSTPIYTWIVNGTIASNNSTYTYPPAPGDVVVLSLASSALCAVPAVVNDTMPMTVLVIGTPAVTLGASPNGTLCVGNPVTLTASPTFGGATPNYAWFVNGSVSGAGINHTYIPANGDVVYCKMVSNYMCRTTNDVSSSNMSMVVDSLYVPAMDIMLSAINIKTGEPLTLKTSVTGAGTSPTFQWQVNGIVIPGATGSSYTSNTFKDYDSVTCIATGSGVCNSVSSKSVVVSVFPGGSGTTNDLYVFPSPSKGSFTIKSIFGATSGKKVSVVVISAIGQTVYTGTLVTGNNGVLNGNIQLPNGIPNGVYFLSLYGDGERKMFRFVVNK